MPSIISVTGTKGKTSVTRGISYVLHAMGNTLLRVDTDGHYINEKQQSTLQDSLAMAGLVPTVCPGRYLLSMKKHLPNFTAVFEAALGSSGGAGVGYRYHSIGIFTNVYEDHLGSSKRLKTRADIARAKEFIFRKVAPGGYAIFNADDPLVVKTLTKLPSEYTTTKIAVTASTKALRGYEIIFTVRDGYAVLQTPTTTKRIIALSKISWTFNGAFKPSVYNVLFILAAIYAYHNKRIPKAAIKHLQQYKLSATGGRLTLLQAKNGHKVLVDYAHEKESLVQVGTLAHTLTSGTVQGVVRLAPDRTDALIKETGAAIADSFDDIIVYDKIDGVSRKEYISSKGTFHRKIGDVSSLLTTAITKTKTSGSVRQIIKEEDAIKLAAQQADPHGITVIICGDDHTATIQNIKKYFKASLV